MSNCLPLSKETAATRAAFRAGVNGRCRCEPAQVWDPEAL